jgi:hypothetical protein
MLINADQAPSETCPVGASADEIFLGIAQQLRWLAWNFAE